MKSRVKQKTITCIDIDIQKYIIVVTITILLSILSFYHSYCTALICTVNKDSEKIFTRTTDLLSDYFICEKNVTFETFDFSKHVKTVYVSKHVKTVPYMFRLFETC